ncbi:MAG TPA: hypothetical protein VHZ05_12390, partial [Acidimicrobiales bacterium]|nr:hypothetical protein [Acidimicrobiales bacterium]
MAREAIGTCRIKGSVPSLLGLPDDDVPRGGIEGTGCALTAGAISFTARGTGVIDAKVRQRHWTLTR